MAVVLLIGAGCGSSAGRHDSAPRRIPARLAQDWATQASAIAAAAAVGDSCRAFHLAAQLRDVVIRNEGQVPARLRAPLATGVNALADRTTCPPPPVKPKPPPPKEHGHHHHHHGGDGGDQGGGQS